MKAKTRPVTTHDEYLAPLSDDKRRALEKLRKDIKAVAPKAEECISYGIPGFRLKWKAAGKLRRGGEALRFLSRFDAASVQGRVEGLRHERQGHDPICGG
jgi:hypothetical protein